MQVHRLITLTASAMLHKSGTAAFNLNTASSLLLNMFHVCTAMSDDLRTEVETWDWLKVNWNSLLRPFTLNIIKPVSCATKIGRISSLHDQIHPAQLGPALAS
jgi:hypothetical protein